MNQTTPAIYNKKVVLLLTIIFLNTMGIGISQIYALIYIYDITLSNFYVALQGGIVFGAGVVSSYFFMHHKKNINLVVYMILSELSSCAAMLLLAYKLTVPSLYLALIIAYIAYGFFKPSYQAFLYAVVAQQQQITHINSLSSILSSLALIIGWFIAPLCFKFVNYRGIFFLTAITFLICALLLLLLRNKAALGNPAVSLGRGANELPLPRKLFHFPGTKSLPANVTLFNMLFLSAAITIIKAATDALEIGVLRTSYHLSDMLIGIFFICWTGGGIVAGIINNFFSMQTFRNLRFLQLNTLLFMGAVFVFVFFQNKYVGIMFYTLCGFLHVFADIFSNNYIYHNTAQAKHAVNFGLKNAVVNGIMLTCLPCLGYLADLFSLKTSLGVAIMLSGVLVILENLGISRFIVTKKGII